jgi:hypothetical protein
MKIIKVDNLGRDTVDDVLIAENVLSYYIGSIVEALNQDICTDAGAWFMAMEDEYELKTWEP